MMLLYGTLIFSLLINILLGWYVTRLLKKFMYISANMADLYLITKAFNVFVSDLYSMDSFHGEPMIEEMVTRIREVSEEMEAFRSIFEYTLDEEVDNELEEALNAEEKEQKKPLFYAGP